MRISDFLFARGPISEMRMWIWEPISELRQLSVLFFKMAICEVCVAVQTTREHQPAVCRMWYLQDSTLWCRLGISVIMLYRCLYILGFEYENMTVGFCGWQRRRKGACKFATELFSFVVCAQVNRSQIRNLDKSARIVAASK